MSVLEICVLMNENSSFLQHFSRESIPRRTPGSSCIWHMPQSRVIQQPMFARWTAMSWFWQSSFSRPSAYRSSGWALVAENITVRCIPVHAIYSNLVPSKSLALPLFHSLTGCDTTSQFLGCGKKTAWAAWASIPEVTDTLVTLTQDPDLFTLESVHMRRIERFVVLMYSKGCGADGSHIGFYQYGSLKGRLSWRS